MNNNNLEGISDFFYKITSNYLDILKDYWTSAGYTTLLVEKTNELAIDTLVVNFGTDTQPLNITFTFIPLPDSDIGSDTVLLQIYALLSCKPQIENMNELEKTLHFLNNQLPVGSLGISKSNEVILKTIQGISTANYDLDVTPLEKIRELFEIIISIFTPHISDICNGKKTFKQLAFELNN